jgi:hypothetical protein
MLLLSVPGSFHGGWSSLAAPGCDGFTIGSVLCNLLRKKTGTHARVCAGWTYYLRWLSFHKICQSVDCIREALIEIFIRNSGHTL